MHSPESGGHHLAELLQVCNTFGQSDNTEAFVDEGSLTPVCKYKSWTTGQIPALGGTSKLQGHIRHHLEVYVNEVYLESFMEFRNIERMAFVNVDWSIYASYLGF